MVKKEDLQKTALSTKKHSLRRKELLKKGPNASKSQTSVEKSKSGTLADILTKLGLTPKK